MGFLVYSEPNPCVRNALLSDLGPIGAALRHRHILLRPRLQLGSSALQVCEYTEHVLAYMWECASVGLGAAVRVDLNGSLNGSEALLPSYIYLVSRCLHMVFIERVH